MLAEEDDARPAHHGAHAFEQVVYGLDRSEQDQDPEQGDGLRIIDQGAGQLLPKADDC